MAAESLPTSLEETLAVFEATGTPWTTTEVADRLNLGRRSTYQRLDRLVERDRLETKKVGASGRVWWRPAAVDGTGRDEHERKINERIVETVDDGIYVLDDDERFTRVNDGFTTMTGYDRGDLLGTHASLVFDDDSVATASERQDVLETRDDTTSLEERLHTADGETRRVETHIERFDLGDGRSGRVGVVRDVSERVERERRIERQRERLAALNDVSEVVHDVTDAVLDQSTREEIEVIVCERLAEAYDFAWIGEVDDATETVTCRAAAGVEDYLDGVTISVDPDDERSRGPTGQAVLERDIRVVRDVRTDEAYARWRDHAREYGFVSTAAIPIVHEETLYGVLNVYADRPGTFDETVSDVVGRLGEVVGHAIAAIERKRALMSDDVVELQFRIRDLFDELGVDADVSGQITFEHTVPVGDGEFITFGTTTPDTVDGVRALVEAIPHWLAVTFRDDDRDVAFEMRLTDPPLLSTIAAHGGSIQQARIEDGDYHLTVHLSPGVEVRQFIDWLQEAYPTIETLTRRQVTRRENAAARVERVLAEQLTERQRAALETAFYAGFFEWPRETTGEDVAASLDIAPSTFAQHLRKAERKVVAELVSSRSRS
ncbi:MAG: bacterio-opsin activator domain-containing protein [Haloarculaceae archaeon]